MSLSDDDYLFFNIAEKFVSWAENFAEATLKNIPKKPIEDFNHYNQGEIFGFKMMASFCLELYMKVYCYILIHKKYSYSNKRITNDKELNKFIREEGIYTHCLKELNDYIIKEDPSFNDDILHKAVSYFDCFDDIRSPTPSKNPKQIIGLFEYNDDMFNIFRRTYEFLRYKSRDYIIHIRQKRGDEFDYEIENAKELSQYLYYNDV